MAIGTVAVVARLRALASISRRRAIEAHVASFALTVLTCPIPTASPPLPLRV